MEAKEQCPLKSAVGHRGTDLSPVGHAAVLAPQKAIALVGAFRQPLAPLPMLLPHASSGAEAAPAATAPSPALLLELTGLRAAEPLPIPQPVP